MSRVDYLLDLFLILEFSLWMRYRRWYSRVSIVACHVPQQSASNAFRFYVYETIVHNYCGGNAALGGAVVGAISTVLNNPIDVLKSELQASQGSRSFSQSVSFLQNTIKEKGMSHILFAGLPARIVKIGVGQAVIFQVVQWLSPQKK